MKKYPHPPNEFWKITEGLQHYYKELIILPTRDLETGELGWNISQDGRPKDRKEFNYHDNGMTLEEMKILIEMELL